MTDWSGVLDVEYGTIVLAAPESPPPEVDFPQFWEDKCAAIPGGLQLSVPEKNPRVPTRVRVLDELASPEADWEHVADVGVRVPAGRLQVYSWMPDEDLAGEIDVPTTPLVARIHWAGLQAWLELAGAGRYEEAAGAVSVRIDLVPGDLEGVRTVRTWPAWGPPVHESIAPNGLRRMRGVAVAPRLATLEPIGRTFWPPYPTIEEGTVTSMWRDPLDGSRWAKGSGAGTGSWGYEFLQELSPEEAEALEEASFPQVHTYARDAQGRIWSADQMPLERAPALLYVKPESWQYLEALFGGPAHGVLGYQLVDLPAGWSRITRRPFDGSSPAVIVDDVPGDGSDAFYQRWPDGAEIRW